MFFVSSNTDGCNIIFSTNLLSDVWREFLSTLRPCEYANTWPHHWHIHHSTTKSSSCCLQPLHKLTSEEGDWPSNAFFNFVFKTVYFQFLWWYAYRQKFLSSIWSISSLIITLSYVSHALDLTRTRIYLVHRGNFSFFVGNRELGCSKYKI